VAIPEREKKLTLCLAVSTQYRRVTNRRTDGRTPCDSIVRAMLNHRRLLHGTKELEPPNICSPGAHVILKLGLIQNKHRNETVWCVHTLPTKCEGCLTSLPTAKTCNGNLLLYILDHLINAIDSQQVSALGKLI